MSCKKGVRICKSSDATGMRPQVSAYFCLAFRVYELHRDCFRVLGDLDPVQNPNSPEQKGEKHEINCFINPPTLPFGPSPSVVHDEREVLDFEP